MPSSRYQTFGPFALSYHSGDVFRKALASMWTAIKHSDPSSSLSSAVGVYVWAYKDGNNLVPWNVGKTDRQSFRGRFVQKQESFRKFRDIKPDVDIAVFLLALRTPGGKFRKPTERDTISSNEWLETMLIGAARAKNHNLLNFSKAKKLNTVIVDGYLNDEDIQPSKAAAEFRALLT